ncbi:Ubiquitin domain-containing protein 2 [Nowakowskiella sp. JEL0078]|nr:Ubiquitin domain-containing protein 2 [Nowakowskiella sp. JEL0078]
MGCTSSSARGDGPTQNRPRQNPNQTDESIPGIAQGGNVKLKPWNETKYTHPNQLTQRELNQLRDAFWDTQPSYSGKSEIWQVLKVACECTEITAAQTYIDSAFITVPTGVLSDGCYDELGNQYIIPAYCFTSPTNLILNDGFTADIDTTTASSSDNVLTREKISKTSSIESTPLKSDSNTPINDAKTNKPFRVATPLATSASANTLGITVRLSTAKDIKMTVAQNDSFSAIKKLVEEQEKPQWDSEKKKYKLRFFFMGKTVDERTKIKDTKISDGGVLQVMVVPISL